MLRRATVLLLCVAACAQANAPPTTAAAGAGADAGAPNAASDGGCKRYEEIVMSLEGAPNPPYALAFARGSDALSDDSKTAIEKTIALAMLKGDRPKIRRFAVVGRADADEPKPDELSERRAQAAMRALVAGGIAADRMEVRALGSSAPVTNAAKEVGNRLVTFVSLVDYRGGVRYWADGGFVECTADRDAAVCGPTPEYTPKCLER